jgi:hypothetical protein
MRGKALKTSVSGEVGKKVHGSNLTICDKPHLDMRYSSERVYCGSGPWKRKKSGREGAACQPRLTLFQIYLNTFESHRQCMLRL